MLNNGEVPPDDVPVPEVNTTVVNRHWRWGDAMSSTVTLPSEESGSGGGDMGDTGKKRRGGRMGMSGLRDMLRMLRQNHSEKSAPPPVPSLPRVPSSTASLSTESSIGSQNQHYYSHPHPLPQVGGGPRRGSKTSTGPESVRAMREVVANSPYGGSPLTHKTSARRPSLASIFRLGQKNKGGASSSAGESSQDSRSASRGSNMTGEEDWDRIDSAIDLDGAAKALGIEGSATIKGRKGRLSPFLSEHPHGQGLTSGSRPMTPRRGPDAAQALRIEVEASPRSIRPMRSTRLSNVEEVEDGERQLRSQARTKNRASLPRTSPHRPPSRGRMADSGKTGSVRSAPPQPLDDGLALPGFKLSMTPENIKPLLENARDVHSRCNECLRELRTLLGAVPIAPNVNSFASD
ncbi:hypothetical protein BU15DRAFT_45375 [Melanogaster broomeanus]|nr:hypothetical protein BU15DRAFT_45375 [Melanogaster broomeanus]